MAAVASFDGDVIRYSSGAGAGADALGVHAASRKIGKPVNHHQQQQRKPVIIYMVSPKIIHVEAHEFMSLVQRLTGPEAAAAAGGNKKTSLSSSSPRAAGTTPPPVRVKARALNRPPGASVSVSVTATRQQQLAPPSSSAPSPSGFLFQDLSPLRGGALNGEAAAAAAPLVSPASMSWLHHVAGADHFFSPVGAPASLGSPSAFLDIFGPLPSQHQ